MFLVELCKSLSCIHLIGVQLAVMMQTRSLTALPPSFVQGVLYGFREI